MWEIAWYTEKGTRLVNEDRVSITEQGQTACITLADGVGGQGGGSTAATAVTRKMAEIFKEQRKQGDSLGGPKGRQRMEEAFNRVNRAVLNMQTPMCRLQATCVTLWLQEENDGFRAMWAHVGDSRLYLFRNGSLEYRTRDHSIAELFKDTDKEINRNVIWQAMGEPEGIRPEISKPIMLEEGAVFLLCSDGVWDCVTQEEMEDALKASGNMEEWIRWLRDRVQETGKDEYDNHTAVAVLLKK